MRSIRTNNVVNIVLVGNKKNMYKLLVGIVIAKATPRKARLTAFHAICRKIG